VVSHVRTFHHTPGQTYRQHPQQQQVLCQAVTCILLGTGNPHSLFGAAPPAPTAEEVLNANPDDGASSQPPPTNKLASFGKFWQGMTSGSQQEDAAQPSSRRTTVSGAAIDHLVVADTLCKRKSLHRLVHGAQQ